jgi:DNA-binding response OmpR family regulator
VIVLLIGGDESKQSARKAALQAAGFRTLLTQNMDDAWRKLDGFDIGAIVIDHALVDHEDANNLGNRYITLRLQENTSAEETVLALANLFFKGPQTLQ